MKRQNVHITEMTKKNNSSEKMSFTHLEKTNKENQDENFFEADFLFKNPGSGVMLSLSVLGHFQKKKGECVQRVLYAGFCCLPLLAKIKCI